MTDTARVVPIDVAALSAWRRRLDAARGDAIAGLLSFARACYEFQQDCAAKQGGSVYTASMAEWFGIKNPASSQWATVGAHAQKLLDASNKLPPMMETLYLLCAVPDNVIRDRVTEKTTNREARALKEEHAPGKKRVHAVPASASAVEPQREPGEHLNECDERKLRHGLSGSDQKKLERAIRIETERLCGEFWKQLYAEVDKRMPEIKAQREKDIEEAQEEKRYYEELTTRIERTITHLITEKEWRLVIGLMHPDHAPAGREKQYAQAFIILRRLDGKWPKRRAPRARREAQAVNSPC